MKRILRAGVITVLFVLPTYAEAPAHWDKPSCYIHVHSQCYGNGQNNCDAEGYKWGLKECDGHYPSAAIARPVKPLGLVAISRSNPRTIEAIRNSFKPKAK